MPLILILVGCLTCLPPLVIYFLVLAGLNHRSRPTLVRGAWDFAGTLAGLSGFLIYAGPALLVGLHHASQGAVAGRSFAALRGIGPPPTASWQAAWSVYFLLVVGGGLGLLWLRRRKTMIYNIEPIDLEPALERVFDRLGLSWSRRGDRYHLSAAANGKPAESTGRTLLDIDAFPALWHVTLHWRQLDGSIRRDVEGELSRELALIETPPTPVAGWLLTISVCLFAAVVFALMIVILAVLANRLPA